MSMFESAMALEALSGDSDRDFPRGMRVLREEIAANPEKHKWAIEENKRRRKP